MPKIDDTPSKVATNALANIPFGSLIGGPLDACIEAQAKSALTTVDFIKTVGFGRSPKTGLEEALAVTFRYKSNGRIVELEVPLLTIVPVPYIRVDSIDINFIANIAAESSTSETIEESSEAGGSLKGGAKFWFVKVEFEGKYSSKKDSKATQESAYSVEYTMDVKVRATSDAMPGGLAKVLNLLESSISMGTPPALLGLRSARPAIAAGQPETGVTMALVASDGSPIGEKTVSLSQTPQDAVSLDSAEVKLNAQGGGTFKVSRKDPPPEEGQVVITGTVELDSGEVVTADLTLGVT